MDVEKILEEAKAPLSFGCPVRYTRFPDGSEIYAGDENEGFGVPICKLYNKADGVSIERVLNLHPKLIAAIRQLRAENRKLHAIMAMLDSGNSDEGIVLAMQCDYAAMKGGD